MENSKKEKPYQRKTDNKGVDLLTDYQIRSQLYDPQGLDEIWAFEIGCSGQETKSAYETKYKS